MTDGDGAGFQTERTRLGRGELQFVQAEDQKKDAPSRNALRTLEPQDNTVAPFQVDVSLRVIGGVEQLTADARELHKKLESGNDFSTWFANRVRQYKFVKNQDFGIILQTQEKSGRGRPPKDYAITMDMAKRLSMVEETEVGKQAQTYFIEREKMSYELQAKQVAPAMDDRFDQVLGALRRIARTQRAGSVLRSSYRPRQFRDFHGVQ